MAAYVSLLGQPQSFPQSQQVDPVSYHVAALEKHEAKMEMLTPKIQKLETLVNRYTEKPYLIQKGFGDLDGRLSREDGRRN